MIVNINTWTVAPGKQAQVKEFWPKFQQYWKEKQPEATRTAMLSITGPDPGNKLTMITTFNSFADWERSRELRREQKQDPKWQALSKQHGDLFVPGSRRLTAHEMIS